VLSDPVAPDVVALGLPLANGAASFTGSNALLIDQPGRRYRLQFTAAGVPPAQTRSFTLGPGSVQILGPASFCAGEFGSYGTGQPADRWDEYRWLVDGAPAAFTPTLLLQNPPLALGPHTLDLTTRIDACTAAAPQRSLQLGDLVSVTLSAPVGAAVVCVNCIGGSIKALPVGGGAVTYQWGYRTESGMPPVVDLPGETADTYVLKGAGFPGPGNYYVVVTVTSACAATVQVSTNEWPVTIQASVPTGEVQHLAASSRGDSTNGQNNLLWVNSTGGIEEIRIRWNVAPLGTSDCLPPPNLGAPYDGEAMLAAPRPTRDDYPHPGLLLNTAYCYSVFVKASGVWSAGRTVRARPFDATAGPVRWAYATGGTAVVPPTVSGPGVLVMSNDRTVHALTRGAAGGEWPPSWTPNELSGVASTRSPVVPFTAPLNGASTVLFAADDAGFVHAFDAATGVRPWPAQGPGLVMTGAPGGIFTQWGGNRDLLFVGTRDGAVNNALRALNLANGTLFEAYAPGASPGPIGPINGTPAIDYATKRVYFASHQRLGGDTLFCLEIADPPAVPPGVLTYKWSRNLGNITGSPVLRGGRVYVGTEAGTIYSIDAADGSNTLLDHVFTPAPFDGPVKGFLFPDRRNDGLIFATDTKVWSVSDGVTSITKNWEWTAGGLNPSLVLYWPQTNYVYVGSANGKLYQLDFSSADLATPPTAIPLTLGDGVATGQIGAPSLDIGVTPRLLVVGSESGVLFGVAVPF
jgi:outer membrane protein assembly factor BamB